MGVGKGPIFLSAGASLTPRNTLFHMCYCYVPNSVGSWANHMGVVKGIPKRFWNAGDPSLGIWVWLIP